MLKLTAQMTEFTFVPPPDPTKIHVPSEIALQVLEETTRLDGRSLVNLSSVNRTFRNVYNDGKLLEQFARNFIPNDCWEICCMMRMLAFEAFEVRGVPVGSEYDARFDRFVDAVTGEEWSRTMEQRMFPSKFLPGAVRLHALVRHIDWAVEEVVDRNGDPLCGDPYRPLDFTVYMKDAEEKKGKGRAQESDSKMSSARRLHLQFLFERRIFRGGRSKESLDKLYQHLGVDRNTFTNAIPLERLTELVYSLTGLTKDSALSTMLKTVPIGMSNPGMKYAREAELEELYELAFIDNPEELMDTIWDTVWRSYGDRNLPPINREVEPTVPLWAKSGNEVVEREREDEREVQCDGKKRRTG